MEFSRIRIMFRSGSFITNYYIPELIRKSFRPTIFLNWYTLVTIKFRFRQALFKKRLTGIHGMLWCTLKPLNTQLCPTARQIIWLARLIWWLQPYNAIDWFSSASRPNIHVFLITTLNSVSYQCARGKSSIARKPEIHPKHSLVAKTFQKCNPLDFKFYLGSLTNKFFPHKIT